MSKLKTIHNDFSFLLLFNSIEKKRQKYIVIVIICFLALKITAQEQSIESKINKLIEKNKQEKNVAVSMENYQQICELYWYYNPSKVEYYNKKIAAIALKHNFLKGYGYYYLNKGVSKQQAAKNDAMYLYKAFTLFKKIDNAKYRIISSYYYANSKYLQGQSKHAIKIVNQALDYAVKKNITIDLLGDLYLLKGYVNYREANLRQALENYKKALIAYDANIDGFNKKADVYLYIAFTYTDLENYQETIKYIDLANQIKVEASHNMEKALALNKLSEHAKAIKILEYNREHKLCKNKEEINYNDFLIAETYFFLGRYKTCLKLVNQLLNKQINEYVKIHSLNLATNCLLKVKSNMQARIVNNKALQIIDSSSFPGVKEAAYLAKSEIEAASGNYKKALFYQKKYYQLYENSNNQKNKERIQKLQIDLKVYEKENKIKELKYHEIKKNMEINGYKNKIVTISFILVLIIFFLFYFFYSNNQTKKKNIIIEMKNTALQHSIYEKETLLKEIHHRVKNNMQLVISLLKIQSRRSNKLTIEDFISNSENRIRSMALIHQYLYESEDINYVNFEAYTKKLISSILNAHSGFDNVSVKLEIQKVSFDIERSIALGLILNELVGNAYKHAFQESEKGTVGIKLKKEDNFWNLIISDNGRGLPDDYEERKNKSVGMQIVKLLVSQIGGYIKTENDLGAKISILFK